MKALLAFAVLVALAGVVEASHFRYHTAYYTRHATLPRQITMTIKQAWRRTAFFSASGNVLGLTFQPMGVDWRDGSPVDYPNFVVTSTDPVDDWIAGEVTITHNFLGSATSFDVVLENCCRISTLLDGNRDQSVRMTHVVKLGANGPASSPQIDSLPMIPFALNLVNVVQLPLIPGSDGTPVTFAISPAGGVDPHSSLLVNAKPSAAFGPFSFSPSGVITWTPNTPGLYAFQVNATSPLGVVNPLDVILYVRAGSVNHQPPVITQPNPNTINFTPGQVVSFNVVAVDPDSLDDVTITAGTLPIGATLGGCVGPEPQTTCTAPFSWPSTPTSGPQVICFLARDLANNVSNQHCVTLIPNANQPCANGNCPTKKTVGTHCYANSAPVSVTGTGNCASLEFNPATQTC